MGIQEKKMTREITELIDGEYLPSLKTASGNDELVFELAVNEEMDADAIRIAGSNVKEFVEGFLEICKDADYKEEIVKVNKIVMTLKHEVARDAKCDTYGDMSLDGETMNVAVNGKNSFGNGSSASYSKADNDSLLIFRFSTNRASFQRLARLKYF